MNIPDNLLIRSLKILDFKLDWLQKQPSRTGALFETQNLNNTFVWIIIPKK